MKRYSTPLSRREMQVKTTITYQLISVKITDTEMVRDKKDW